MFLFDLQVKTGVCSLNWGPIPSLHQIFVLLLGVLYIVVLPPNGFSETELKLIPVRYADYEVCTMCRCDLAKYNSRESVSGVYL